MLGSPDFRARAAATRVLCYWRDRVPDALELLKKLAADPHPRVRLEAVRAASFFTVPEAVEVALISAEQPTDQYLDFVRGETMKALSRIVQEGHRREACDPVHHGRRRALLPEERDDRRSAQDEAQPRRSDLELLLRKGVRDEYRQRGAGGPGEAQEQERAAGAARRNP